MKSAALKIEDWRVLRDLVLDAQWTKTLHIEKIRKEDFPELVSLVEDYLKTGNGKHIDKAALLVASMCPGIDPEVARVNPWLLLEKS